MRAQMRPRVFKKRAKGVQETSGSVQKLPKSSPSAAKTCPRQAEVGNFMLGVTFGNLWNLIFRL